MPVPIIFHDTGQTLFDFANTIYVRCPQCGRCASVLRIHPPKDTLQAPQNVRARLSYPYRLSCLHCGYTRTRDGNETVEHPQSDWYFGQPLWLQIPCCGQTLWALNGEHLNWLERYVSATQRARFFVPGQIRNQTMASRLPLWMKSAKNRTAVLQGIAHLKVRLASV